MRNLDITSLRSFVAVAQAGGVTRASGFLNLTQSAVSMQLKRLEEMLGLKLLDRSGRGVALTASGEQLLGYAQRMIELNDGIYAKLTDQAFEGEITLGVPHDIVYPVIPKVLQRMGAAFPRVKLQLISSYTTSLREQFSRGEIDVILTTEGEVGAGSETLAEVPLRWIGAPGGQAWKTRPLRLAFCRYCGFRNGALRRLDEAGVPWEMAVDSESDRTIEATVSADLAITTMLEGHAPPHLVHVETGGALPDLGVMRINLYSSSAQSEVADALKSLVRQEFAAL